MEWIMTCWWPQHGTTGPAASATENEESPVLDGTTEPATSATGNEESSDLDNDADAPGPPKSQSVKPMSIDVKSCPSDPGTPGSRGQRPWGGH